MISGITAAAMIPTFCAFLLAPILDVRFSRRTYALAFGAAAAATAFLALSSLDNLAHLGALLAIGFLAASLFTSALGGWLGSIVLPTDAGRLASGFTIGNIGGFGIGAILFITLLRAFPGPYGAALVSGLLASPLLLLAVIPISRAQGRGMQESFATLGRDLIALVKQRVVLRTLLLFSLPAASFALTNTLGGLGADFGASERFVALVAGIGSTAAAVVGSLLIPKAIDRFSPRLTYLAIGSIGALFTASLIALPRTPAVFALALIGQNLFQATAFVVESTIIFRSIGQKNPLAATQFAFLNAASALPITYMQGVDGRAYGAGGLPGMLITDAGLAVVACSILLPLVIRWGREDRTRNR